VDSQDGRYPLSANLDLVRSIYAAWERGDFSSAGWAHPEIELVIADGPDPSVSTGLVGMLEGRSTVLDAWEDWRPEVEEYRELDGERVLVLTRPRARGKTSHVQVWSQGANLIDVRGGRVIRIVHYWDREHALADLGLASEGGS
jgi:ketosteroid isomerase-like protein